MKSSNLRRKRGRPSLAQELDVNSLLTIALEHFSNFGFEGAQLKIIAEKVGITNSLISYHFKNKEELWKKSVDHLAKSIVGKFEEIRSELKDTEGVPMLRSYTRQLIYFSAKNPPFYKLTYMEMGKNSWRSDYLINSIVEPLTIIGQSALNKASTNPNFTSIPKPNFVSIIFGACCSFFMLTRLIEHQYDISTFDHEHIEKHADLVNKIIFDSFE
ncbi:TetR family transcriptional regulator [Flavobacteriaceae bacterium]|nr:TetR family transcriptional regulator [Flavobacteriaceae bacterium]